MRINLRQGRKIHWGWRRGQEWTSTEHIVCERYCVGGFPLRCLNEKTEAPVCDIQIH